MCNLFLIDWFSCTVPSNLELFNVSGSFQDGSAFCSILGLRFDDFTETSGVRGFSKRLYFEGISIHLPSDQQPFCWLEMSGQGCRSFESYGSGDWVSVFNVALAYCNIKRIDIAFDDHSGLLPLSRIFSDTLSRNYVSKCRKHQVEVSIDDTSPFRGVSVYHGSQSSNVLIRIYDKAAQLGFDEHWVRCEIQLKDINASNFISEYLVSGNLGLLYRGVLLNYFRYIVPSADSNISRCQLTDYWNNFIADCSKIKVYSKPGAVYNFSNLEHFVIDQAGNAILTYLRIFGYFGLMEKLNEYSRKLPPKYEALLKSYQVQKNH